MLPAVDLIESDKKQKKTTTTITFRIDSNIMNKIYSKAEQEDITLNTLINHILKRYVEWDMYEGKAGMVPINKLVLKKLFQGLSEEEVINISRDIAKSAVYNIALFMKGKGKLDVDSFVSWFLSRMKNCSEIMENKENGTSTYIIKHDIGMNWSLYHKTVLESIFTENLQKPVQTSMTESTLTFTIENNNTFG
jgi:DNA-directed RNA polymerase subunit L